jgi:hypothetical protein
MMHSPLKTNRATELFHIAFEETAKFSNMSPQDTSSAMRHGDCVECEEFHQRLASLIAQSLAEREPTLRAVYRFDPTFASGEDGRVRTLPSESSAIDLLVWTETKTDGLLADVRALQEDLAQERLNWLCPKAVPWCHALNIVLIDDAEVRARRGYAALLDSLWVRPTKVWGQEDGSARRARI